MVGEWRTASIDELKADVRNAIAMGPFGSRIRTENFVPGGVPVIRGGNLNDERFHDADFVFLTEEKADELRAANATNLDIVITHRGTLGQVGIIPETSRYSRYVVSQSQLKVTIDPGKANPYFVFYYLRSPEGQRQLLASTSQTGVPAIAGPTRAVKSIRVPCPPLGEQRAIALILSTLDGKIELNKRSGKTIETMARAIFKSWFVNFDPVRAMIEGRETGLPKVIADLFPNRFEDSEVGDIPTGWRVGTVDEEFNVTMGQSPPGETYNETGEGLPFFQGRTDFGFRFPTRRVFCSAPTRFAEKRDTLVSVRAPVGDINMSTERCCVGRGVAAVRHKSGASSYTYYSMWSLKAAFERFEAQGTVFGSINKKDFHGLVCVAPPPHTVAAFERIGGALDDHLGAVEEQLRTLAALRDTLLPKLISGELRVPDPSRIEGGASA